MTFNDPNRPGLDPARPLPPLTDPRLNDGPRPAISNGAMWLGVIVAAAIVGGAIFVFSGNVDGSGVATNTTPPTTIQPAPDTSTPAPTLAPSTTGQAPASSKTDLPPALSATDQPPARQ
jgi:hypothetical protein